jgi:hypothetical protein
LLPCKDNWKRLKAKQQVAVAKLPHKLPHHKLAAHSIPQIHWLPCNKLIKPNRPELERLTQKHMELQ